MFDNIRETISEFTVKRQLDGQVDAVTQGARLAPGTARVELDDDIVYEIIVESPSAGPAPHTITVESNGRRLTSKPVGSPQTKSHRSSMLAGIIQDAMEADDRF